MIVTLDTALPFPYLKIIAAPTARRPARSDRTRCNYRPINCRETARGRFLTVGNINSELAINFHQPATLDKVL